MANLNKTFISGEVLKASELNEMVAAINAKQEGLTTAQLEKLNNTSAGGYEKPEGGIPSTDLSTDVQTALSNANSALQSFTETDPVFAASAAATITEQMISDWNNNTGGETKTLSVKTGSQDYVEVNDHEIGVSTVSISAVGLTKATEGENAGQWVPGTATTETGLAIAGDVAAELVADEEVIANALNDHEDRISTLEAKHQQPAEAPAVQVTQDTVANWGFTKNTGTVTSVNGVDPVDGNVTLSIPEEVTETTVAGWGFAKSSEISASILSFSADLSGLDADDYENKLVLTAEPALYATTKVAFVDIELPSTSQIVSVKSDTIPFINQFIVNPEATVMVNINGEYWQVVDFGEMTYGFVRYGSDATQNSLGTKGSNGFCWLTASEDHTSEYPSNDVAPNINNISACHVDSTTWKSEFVKIAPTTLV